MPMSKNGKLYYTEEQFNRAKYEVTALDYARQCGMPLVQQGKYWAHAEHDSLVFVPNGKFFWNSQNISGDAIALASYFQGKTYIEAVLAVAGEQEHTQQTKKEVLENLDKAASEQKTLPKVDVIPIEFKLPEKSENQKRLFAYLCSERKIDNTIVSTMVHEKRLFQSAEHGNVVFVGYDENGEAASAFQRGTYTFVKEAFKRDVAGSRKEIPFLMPSDTNSNTVYVFEASIDALSHATLTKYSPDGNWRDVDRISLGGVSEKALNWYLEKTPHIKNVVLCLDNDPAGKAATERIGTSLAQRDYEVSIQTPNGKDWNDDLKSYNQAEVEQNKFSMLLSNSSADNDIKVEEFEM